AMSLENALRAVGAIDPPDRYVGVLADSRDPLAVGAELRVVDQLLSATQRHLRARFAANDDRASHVDVHEAAPGRVESRGPHLVVGADLIHAPSAALREVPEPNIPR